MRSTVAVALCILLTGCAMGPNYKRPVVQVPPEYRQPTQDTNPPDKKSLADVAWADLFHDETITNLVKAALSQSHDLEAATQRVLEARAQLGITSSQLFPQLSASGSFTGSRTSSIGQFGKLVVPATSYTQVGLNLSWEIDIWGRLRRLTEAARAQYLSQEDAQHAVITSLVAEVMTAYFDLRELDLELEIGRQTEEVAKKGLRITTLRKELGVATGLDISQAQEFLYTATTQVAAAERAIAETENTLSVLLGQNPGDITRGKRLVEFASGAEIRAGLPSDLLERRPDIQEAEHTLIAANAQIGAAKALYFPQITLTGLLGAQSRYLSNLFTAPGRQQNIGPAAILPIFNAGAVRNGVRLSEAQKSEAIANYRKAIQSGLQDVSNALTDYAKNREELSQQELLVKSLENADRISVLRYRGGLDSYLQVLDAQRSEFSGELTLAQLRRNQLLSIVELYRALGGGWQNP